MSHKELTLKDFEIKRTDGNDRYLSYELPDQLGEICIEPCLSGFCVARYDHEQNLEGRKLCTNFQTEIFNHITALEEAIKLANLI